MTRWMMRSAFLLLGLAAAASSVSAREMSAEEAAWQGGTPDRVQRERGDGEVEREMLIGDADCAKLAAPPKAPPPAHLAPTRSIRLVIAGPLADVDQWTKDFDLAALGALTAGPTVPVAEPVAAPAKAPALPPKPSFAPKPSAPSSPPQ